MTEIIQILLYESITLFDEQRLYATIFERVGIERLR